MLNTVSLRTELTLPEVSEDGREVSGSPSDAHVVCRERPLPAWHRRSRDFWEKVYRTDCCWLWIGSRKSGYGAAWVEGRLESAHRVAWRLTNGEIPDGQAQRVLHHCDVKHCVRPDHLWLGTSAENTADMDEKGRRTYRQPRAKLTRGHVHAIRRLYALGEGQATLARWFDLTPVGIWKVVHTETWKHLVDAEAEPVA